MTDGTNLIADGATLAKDGCTMQQTVNVRTPKVPIAREYFIGRDGVRHGQQVGLELYGWAIHYDRQPYR